MSQSDVWQEALRMEHQAVYGFGLVGGQLGPEDTLTQASLALHRERVQVCQEVLRNIGVEPDAGSAAYTPNSAITNAGKARNLAADLESNCASAYVGLVGDTNPLTRRTGAAWLRTSAVAQLRWSGQVPALPGLES